MDRELNKFFSQVSDSGVGIGESFITITSDHGEGLGNHGYWGHSNNIYNEQVRVPVWIHEPDTPNMPKTVDQVVELTDLAPTILMEAGVSSESIKRHRNSRIKGQPLQYLYQFSGNNRPGQFGFALSQRTDWEETFPGKDKLIKVRRWWKRLMNPHLLPMNTPVFGQQFSLSTRRFKYIYHTNDDDEFYVLDGDFYEQDDTIATDDVKLQQQATRLGSNLLHETNRLKSGRRFESRSADTTTRRRLKSLGYIE